MKLNASRNSGGDPVYFRKPCASKTAGLRVKDTPRSHAIQFYVVIVFHLVKQSAKGFLFVLVGNLTRIILACLASLCGFI